MSLRTKAKKLEGGQRRLVDRITPAQKKELIALREDYRAGDLKHVTKKALTDLVCEEFGLGTLSPATLGAFLDDPEKQGGK
jgi:hypothetical protein